MHCNFPYMEKPDGKPFHPRRVIQDNGPSRRGLPHPHRFRCKVEWEEPSSRSRRAEVRESTHIPGLGELLWRLIWHLCPKSTYGRLTEDLWCSESERQWIFLLTSGMSPGSHSGVQGSNYSAHKHSCEIYPLLCRDLEPLICDQVKIKHIPFSAAIMGPPTRVTLWQYGAVPSISLTSSSSQSCVLDRGRRWLVPKRVECWRS